MLCIKVKNRMLWKPAENYKRDFEEGNNALDCFCKLLLLEFVSMNLGAHMSISGGLYKAPERGRAVGCNVIQIFTKNERQWRAKPLVKEDVDAFRKSLTQNNIRVAFAHDTYLINLATADKEMWEKSVNAFLEELTRCNTLGLDFLVTHPGSPRDAGLNAGIKNMVKALNQVLKAAKNFHTQILLETTAGQGSTVGSKFEEMAEIISGLNSSDKVAVCFDTCHTFAAGYDIRTKKGYEATMANFDRALGLDKLKAFHLNDSKKDLGSRVDRHEHIGKGYIDLEAFRLLMNDERFFNTPMVLETPKEDNMDVENLRVLRELRKKKGAELCLAR